MILKLIEFVKINRVIIIVILLSVLFLIFYPSKSINVDEQNYISNANNIVNGTLRMNCSNNDGSMYKVGDFCIYKYNIGTSIFLIPSVLINDNSVYLTTFVIFILSIVLFDKLLLYFKLDSIYLYYFALFPAYTYYYRTAFSEVYSMFLILLSIYLILRMTQNKNLFYMIILGVSLSLLVFTRYSLIPVVIILLIFNIVINRKSALITVLTALPFGILFLLFNNYLYLNPFRSGYFYSGEESRLSINYLIEVLPKYFLTLNAIYPFMMISMFFSKLKLKFVTIISVLFMLIYYSLTGLNSYVFEGRILDLILGIRFFIPLTPLLILPFIEQVSKLKSKYLVYFHPLLILCLIVITILIHIVHRNFLRNY